MSNTGVFAPPMGWCLHPIWGMLKKIFRYANLSTLPLSYTPHFPNPRNIPGRVPLSPSLFCLVTTRPFGNFATADFHQIWSRNVVRCPVNESRKTVSNIFTLWVICPQNLTSKLGQTGTSLRAGYWSRDALQRDIVYSTL